MMSKKGIYLESPDKYLKEKRRMEKKKPLGEGTGRCGIIINTTSLKQEKKYMYSEQLKNTQALIYKVTGIR